LSAEDVQSEILQRLTRVETKLDMQINAKDMAAEALDKSKSAHYRIAEEKQRADEKSKHYDDEIKLLNARIETEAKDLNARIDTENRERKTDRRWIIGTTLTAAGLIVAIIKLF
jgi:alkanesulfonate monooxygenase SsuD/methylene tetrahydromethanopterin reductase-like flavin-dependent oxidoreductase (luciferase family)